MKFSNEKIIFLPKVMNSWQETLKLIVHKNNTFSTNYKDYNEFKIMQYFVNETIIRDDLLHWLHNLECNKSLYKKNIQKSKELRKQGNNAFQNKNYIFSIKCYTLSLQYAPWDSEDLPLALANRSAALFYANKYESCIKDINLAIEYNYPKKMIYKLYLRAAQSYFKLHNKKLMEEALCKLHKCLENNNLLLNSKKESIKEQIDELLSEFTNIEDTENNLNADSKMSKLAFDENPYFPNASIALSLKFSEEKGRHVVANRDIKKSEILFVEKPFAFVLLDNIDSDAVCAHCCESRGDVPIPCKFCACTMYCTTKCQNDAWSRYHQWECFGNQIGLWDQIGIAHLTIRTFLNCCCTEDIEKFNDVQKLVTNIDKISSQDMFVYGVSALMMTLYLSKFTKFFQIINIYEKFYIKSRNMKVNKFESSEVHSDKWSEDISIIYVSGILLRNMLQLICNGHAITRLNSIVSEVKNITTEYQCRIATAIYPSASMMNHSCDPNIINSFKDQYLIVKAVKDISCNSEILNCYGPHYRRMRKKERQLALKNQYCFTCNCEACSQPTLQNFSDKFQSLSCEECNGPIEIKNCTLFCSDCQLFFDLNKSKLRKLEEANQLYDIAYNWLQKENTKTALEKAKKCLNIRKQHLFEYHEAIALTYDLISKILASTGQWIDCILYLEYSIAAIEERFGSDSIEVANELNKMTDICIQYLSEDENSNSKQYKNILKKTKRFLLRAEQILDLNYGPWNEAYNEIIEKQHDLMPLIVNLNL